jgi:hypothetical protein
MKRTIFKPKRAKTIDPRFDENATTEFKPAQY